MQHSSKQAVPATADPDGPLLRRVDGGVCTLTLNRPEQYNALSEALIDELTAAIQSLADDDEVRLVVVSGNGPAFCAGHDLKEMRQSPARAYYERLFKKCGRLMVAMVRLPKPVIARVHGVATAAGCQLVAGCDMAVASSEARFGTSGIRVGLFCMSPGVAVSRNLSRKHAFEMLFTGDLISAERARELGLVNRVVAPEALDQELEALAGAVLSKSQAAVEAGKRVFYQQLEMGLSAAYDYAGEEMAANMMFHDAGEGIDAFFAKRKPVWLHE